MRTLILFLLVMGAAHAKTEVVHLVGKSNSKTHPVDWYGVIDRSPEAYDRIKKGDLVSYRARDGRFICHIAFKRMKGGWWTKGSANKLPDNEYVTRENFFGLVIGKAS